MGKRLAPRKVIEVSDKHIGLRIALFVVLLAIGIGFLVYGCVADDDSYQGWQRLEVTSEKAKAASQVVGEYFCGDGKADAREEYRQVNALYDQASADAWGYFSDEGELTKINAAPNQEVTVSQPVYTALALMADSRYLYTKPLQHVYVDLFLAETDMQASLQDPAYDQDAKAVQTQLAAFCADPQQVQLKLLGNNTVCLKVGQEYLTYAQEEGVEEFITFGWMTNAFVVDHIADTLEAKGYTNGHISSVDGFTRNLDQRGISYDLNIYSREGNNVDIAGRIQYTQPMAMVFLRDYPLSNKDVGKYYAYDDHRRIVTSYLDPTDGMDKTACHNLLACSENASCAEIALALAPVFISDTFREADLQALAQQEIYSYWFDGLNLCYNWESQMPQLNADCVIPYVTKLRK